MQSEIKKKAQIKRWVIVEAFCVCVIVYFYQNKAE